MHQNEEPNQIIREAIAATGEGGGKVSTAKLLVNLTLESGCDIHLDELGEPHVCLPDKPLVSYPLSSQTFRRWLCGKFWDEAQKGVSTYALSQALNTLEGLAFHRNKSKKLYNRVARYEGNIFYDLGDNNQVVQVTADGWTIEKSCPVSFRRFKHQCEQVQPQRGGDIAKVLKFVNLPSGNNQLLFLSYLVAALIPDLPRVILTLTGDQGSAKSTAMRIARSLLDPSHSELLTPPSDRNELGQMANHHYCLYFDNLSSLNDEFSDALCRLATGVGFSKRKLYTDDEDILFNQKVAVGINGITLVANKPDILDRCLILNLERIPDGERVNEGDFWKGFNEVKSFILGAIFDALSQVLKTVANH